MSGLTNPNQEFITKIKFTAGSRVWGGDQYVVLDHSSQTWPDKVIAYWPIILDNKFV